MKKKSPEKSNFLSTEYSGKTISWISLGITCALLMSAAFLLVPVANKVALNSPEFVKRTIFSFFFNLLWSISLAYSLLVLPGTGRKIAVILISIIAIAFSTFSVLHFLLYGQLIGTPSLSALIDTNVNEASEFISFAISQKIVVSIVTTLLLTTILSYIMYCSAVKLESTLKSFWIGRISLVLLISMTIFGWHRVSFALNNPILFIVQNGYEVQQNRATYLKMKQQNPEHSGASFLGTDQATSTHLVIVGESASPRHMSLYGYARLTDPFSSQSNPYFTKFWARDACSSQPNTHLSMLDVMTAGQGLGDSNTGKSPANMISTLKDSGYKTYWLSNQPGGAGKFSMASTWGEFADKQIYLNKRDFREGYDFDEILLPAISKSLADPARLKVIFIHLMGSHPDYKQRYPSNFNIWNNSSEIPASVPRRSDKEFNKQLYNEYDNSIAYSDNILKKISEIAANARVDSITYFSDHGQNLGEHSAFIGHSVVGGLRQGYEIPIIFWVSKQALLKDPVRYAVLEKNLQHPLSLHQIQFTLFDFFNIRLNHADDTQSWFSDKHASPSRTCDELKN